MRLSIDDQSQDGSLPLADLHMVNDRIVLMVAAAELCTIYLLRVAGPKCHAGIGQVEDPGAGEGIDRGFKATKS